MTPRSHHRSPVFQGLLSVFLAVAVPAGVAAATATEVETAPAACGSGVCVSGDVSQCAVEAAPCEPLPSRSWVSMLSTEKNVPIIELRLAPVVPSQPAPRPGLLMPMYVSLGALHAVDLRTTLIGRRGGAREANPLAGTTARLIAVKAISLVATIAVAERVWKKKPAAAIALIVAANFAYAAVVVHNYRVIQQQR